MPADPAWQLREVTRAIVMFNTQCPQEQTLLLNELNQLRIGNSFALVPRSAVDRGAIRATEPCCSVESFVFEAAGPVRKQPYGNYG